jgi:hypothetical protein
MGPESPSRVLEWTPRDSSEARIDWPVRGANLFADMPTPVAVDTTADLLDAAGTEWLLPSPLGHVNIAMPSPLGLVVETNADLYRVYASAPGEKKRSCRQRSRHPKAQHCRLPAFISDTVRDLFHLPRATGPERLEGPSEGPEAGNAKLDRGHACRRGRTVIGRMARWFGAHFPLFLRSSVDASVVKVAPMAWGFLQIRKKKTAVEARPGEHALQLVQSLRRSVAQPLPPHRAVLGAVGCFADSVLVLGCMRPAFVPNDRAE